MPSGAVEQQRGMRAFCDLSADLFDVALHRLGVGKRQSQSCSYTALRADGAEQIGAVVTLIGRLPGPRAAPSPLPHLAILLADAGFILEPDFDRRRLRQIGDMRRQRGREVFLKAAMIAASWAGWRGLAEICEKPNCFKSLPT